MPGQHVGHKHKKYIDGLMQKRHNSSALAMELCLFWIKPSMNDHQEQKSLGEELGSTDMTFTTFHWYNLSPEMNFFLFVYTRYATKTLLSLIKQYNSFRGTTWNKSLFFPVFHIYILSPNICTSPNICARFEIGRLLFWFIMGQFNKRTSGLFHWH